MQKYLATLFLIMVLCLGLGQIAVVRAQTEANYITEEEVGVEYGKKLGLGTKDVRLTIASLIRVAMGLLGILTLCIVLVGGFLWMTAGGNDEQIGKAKKLMYRSVVGLIIILAAYSITWLAMKIAFNYTDDPYGAGVKILPDYKNGP